jgi:hypothetical protein
MDRIMGPFAETLGYFPVDKLSIITGADKTGEPISAIHPNARCQRAQRVGCGRLDRGFEQR